MTKRFTLLMLLIGNLLLSFSKSGIQLLEINPANLDNTTAKTGTPDFRYDNTDYLVVQPKTNSASYLTNNKLDVQSYLGDGYFLIKTNAADTKTSLQAIQTFKVGYLSPATKIEDGLKSNASTPVTILYAPSVDAQTISDVCQKIGIGIIHNDIKYHHFTAYANTMQMDKLAQYPFIIYLSKYYEQKNPLIYDASLMIEANEVQQPQPYGYNLKGEGINIGIWDDGPFGNHIDLPVNRNFVIDKKNSNPVYMQHPTEVAGCIGGSGNLFSTLKGIAPRVNMYYWDVLNDINGEIATAKSSYGVDISNHSYNFAATNCIESGLYIAEAADMDKLVYENPTLIPVVAIGNSASVCSVTDTFSSVDIGYQGCKNAIAVGWVFSNEVIVGNSGRGPTTDGRLKPELVAKGFAVNTLFPNNGFQTVYGSSYSAPQVTGLLALMHQKYKQQFGALPHASLMKAILCNTARDLGNPGPDYTFGFGIPDAYKAVYTIDHNLFFEDNAGQGDVKTQMIAVPANISKLSVTLSWTDKEGSPVAAKSIVNDLDLKIVTPAGDTILPWKLDPSLYKNNAKRGIDNLNTIEQVTLTNAAAGNYTIVVKGTNVPFGPQDFSVAYNSQERKIELTHPNGGEILDASSAVNIRWYSNGIDSLGNIEFSSDNGASWVAVVSNYDLTKKTYAWTVPAIISDKCLIRITSGLNSVVSASPFSIGAQVFYPSIGHTVCDKSVKITWPAVGGASAYKIYLFVDTAWINVGQTSLLTYTISNLINGKSYSYSISTIKNGVEGNHSLSNTFTPQATICTTLNDVGVYALSKPVGGRKFSSFGALGSAEKLFFIVKNFGTATQNSITVSYTINGGPVRSAVFTDVVPGFDTTLIKFAVTEDLSAVGSYKVVAWTNLASGDNNTKNDTLVYTIRQLANPQLHLPFYDSFETLNAFLTSYTFGLDGLDYADFNPEDGGRLRTTEGNLYANSGNKAITLDNYVATSSKKNELIFTYNLSLYVDSVVFLDFSYLTRGEPDGNDIVYARGNDTRAWIPIYDLYANRDSVTNYKSVKEINLYQKLRVEFGQLFSATTQIRILHTSSKAALSMYNDGGYTFDDFKLYVAGRDVSVVSADIKKVNCSKSFTPLPLTIKVKNNSALPIVNLPVSYKVDNNATVTEFISDTIHVKDTATYTFTTLFNKSVPGAYSIKTWATNAGDNYKQNDSFNTAKVIVMPTLDSFPYYNDFETNNGNIFSDGINNSWVWATPGKYNMNNAAQDNKAWTTGINKGYNFNEDSYLYMGCMDFSTATIDPLISFNFISIMQTLSDSAYAEYSTDGLSWNRLGCYNCGLNWYNGYHNKPYWDQVIFPWQVAHINVPLASLADKSNFMYRIHLLSDDFAISEGLGIDDVHILKDYQTIAGTDSAYVSTVSTGNGWIQFYRNGKLVAELNDDNKNLGNVTVGFEADPNKHKEFANKNLFPRNWVMRPQNSVLGNYKVRLYALNTEYTDYVLAEDSINRMGDIGLLRYIGLNTNLDIIDNHVKSYYKYLTPADIQFYPYKDGYYIEFTTDTLGEFYLISTRQDQDAIQNINLVEFSAQKINDDVYLEWSTTKEINSKEFIIQYSFDANTFINIDTVPAGGFSTNTTFYNYLHQLNATSGVYYYRIEIVDNSNNVSYSLIDSVNFAPNVGVKQNTTSMNAYISGSDIVVDCKNKLQTPSTVQIYNALGQLQFSKKMQLLNGVNPLGIADFIHWSNGAYFMQIQTKEQNYYSKLLKQ